MNKNASGVVHVPATSGERPTTAITDVSRFGVVDGGTEERQRVHLPDPVVDDVAVVMFPPGLVLLRAAVVVDGEQDAPGPLGGVTEPHRGTAAVRTDFEERRIGHGCRSGDRCIPSASPSSAGMNPFVCSANSRRASASRESVTRCPSG